MKNIILFFVVLCCISCVNGKEKKTSKNGKFSIENSNNRSLGPVHEYKDENGMVWSKDNIWRNTGNSAQDDEDDSYKKGYDDGLKDGKRAGYNQGYEEGVNEDR